MDYKFEELLREYIKQCLTVEHNLYNGEGEDYSLTTTLRWRGDYLTEAYVSIPKDPGLKLAEKL